LKKKNIPRNSFLAAWTASRDNESGVQSYRYSIGTSAGDSNIVSGTTDGTSIAHHSLPLESGRVYFLRVWASNYSGSPGEADTASVRVLFLDDTPPPAGPLIKSVTYAKNTLRASWTLPEEDPESGTVRYEYRVTTVRGRRESVPIPWTSIGTSQELTHEIPLTFPANSSHHLTVRVVNGAGLSTASTRTITK
jgi:hypothetical protein